MTGPHASIVEPAEPSCGAGCGSCRVDVAQLFAQWLHDHVLSEVRAVQLRLESGEMGVDTIARHLLEFEHRLREQQLTAAISGGPVLVAEILQLHVRRLMSLGLTVDVATTTGLEVELAGRQASRVASAVSVLVSNSVNAGATKVEIRASCQRQLLEISVADDAGGFDIDAIPVGRALSRLRSEVGPGLLWARSERELWAVHVGFWLDTANDLRTSA